MSRAAWVVVGAVCAAVVAAGVASPAVARPAPVRVSIGVQTPVVLPYPDGDRDRAVLRVRIDRPARVKMFVADASGRTVRKRYLGTLSPGLHRPTWDVRRKGGSAAPTGTYRIWFRAYKNGYSSVRSRTRTLWVRQQKAVDRTTTLTLRGDAYDRAASTGLGSYPAGADGSIFVGHGSDPTTEAPAWRFGLPARTTAVRVRFAVTVTADDGPVPGYGYLVRGAAGPRFDSADFERPDPAQIPPFDGRWVSASSLASPTQAVTRLVVEPFFNLRVLRVAVDVRYRALVPA